jgi:hypothetical protein
LPSANRKKVLWFFPSRKNFLVKKDAKTFIGLAVGPGGAKPHFCRYEQHYSGAERACDVCSDPPAGEAGDAAAGD